jgi:PLP dependent protein
MSIKSNLEAIQEQLSGTSARLVAVTKTKPVEVLLEAYQAGCRVMGENRVQEMATKWEALPKDIEWHLIGHLQRNKVKYMAPFVHLIHSIDGLELLQEVNKQAAKNDRVIDCLLQIFIAQEETKFGLSPEEAQALLQDPAFAVLENIRIVGLMGMATNTDDLVQIRAEFRSLKNLFEQLKNNVQLIQMAQIALREISMGMSGDFPIALEEGATLVRVGSAIFGHR